MLPNRQVCPVDTHVNYDPSTQQLAQITVLAAEEMRRIGLAPKAALLSHCNIDAANIAYNLLKTGAGGGIAIGPVLLGAAQPVHILTPSATVRRIVNMTALTVAEVNA